MSVSSERAVSRLESALGSAVVCSEPSTCREYAVDGIVPAKVVRPKSAEQAAETVRFAYAEKLAAIPCGARTKLGVGMPPARYDLALDVSELNGVAHYDPGDLTLSVDAGVTLSAIDGLLAENNQFLPLGVPFFDRATIGGTIASGMDSTLRQGYGTARDFLIGAEFINGTGALTKSGGRVVKNVTGYDLHKLLIGSLGTLAVVTRLNFRTFPRAPLRRGFLAAFDNEQDALSMRDKIASSALAPALLEIFSPEASRLLFGTGAKVPAPLVGAGSWQVCLGFEGNAEICERYARDIAQFARESSAHDSLALGEAQFAAIAEQAREAVPLLLGASPLPILFRFSGMPAETAALVRALRSFANSSWIPSAMALHSQGVVHLALLPAATEESLLRQVAYFWKSIASLRGMLDFHVSIPFCPAEWKRELNVWSAPRADLPMMQRVKRAFDPENVLAPARFVGGI